jgi:hypothetical protein
MYHIAVFEYNSWADDIKYWLKAASARVTMLNSNDIMISNSNATVCSTRYYDDGGNGFYTYYKQYTQTIYPETANTKLGVLFSTIEIPHYDSLIVYDGIDTTAPILARLSSSSVTPQKIVAQNSAGALTFSLQPRMDATHYGGSGAGWKAELFCSGTPSPEPGTQVSNLAITNITGNSLTVNMTKGNGVGRILVASEATAVNKSPIDGAYLSANTFFGEGADLGEGNYIIYAGAEESVTVTGLKSNTNYHFSACEFTGTGPFVNYLTANAPTTQGTTAYSKPTLLPTDLQFSFVRPNSMRLAFNPGNGMNRLIVMSKTNITFVPVDGVSYQTASQLSTGERVVYVGNSFSNIEIFNLEQLTQYNFAIFEFNGSDTGTKYLTTPLSGTQSTVGPAIVLKSLNDTYCPNEKVTASFTTTGSFTTNSFVLQLSNELGSFDNPIVLEDSVYTSLSGSFNPNILNAEIPNSIKGGSGYKVRIISTSPQIISDSVRNISIPVVPDPAFTVQDSTFISSVNAGQLQWMRNGAIIEGANDETFNYSLGGIYSLVVTANGCSKVSQTFLVTGNDDTFSDQVIKIYPNPVREKMILEKPAGKDDYYQIYNINGKVVDEGSIAEQRNPLDVTRLVPGMYLIRLQHKGRSVTRTFTKE